MGTVATVCDSAQQWCGSWIASRQPDSLVKRRHARAAPTLDAGHGGGEVAAERLLVRDDGAAVLLAPRLPRLVEFVHPRTLARRDRAAFADEGADRRGQVFQ